MYCYFCMKEVAGENNICECCGRAFARDENRSHLTPGTILMGKYLVGNVLGQGGFGITYAGMDTTLNMRIAIKEYYPQGHASRDCLTTNEITLLTGPNEQYFASGKERFLTEARTLAKFNRSGNIVHARDFFELNNTAYIIMDFVAGNDLKHYLQSHGRIEPQRLVEWFIPILTVLAKVHDEGLVHRDISPDNIIVENDELVLIDFGAARDVDMNKRLSVMLKPGYAPAEQYTSEGASQGPWTDIYAVCATMYECITGQMPDESTVRMYDDHLKWPSELGIAIPPHIENALKHGMANRYNERTQSMRQLIAELKGESAANADPATVLMDDPKTVLMNQDAFTGVQIDPLTTGRPIQTGARTEPIMQTPAGAQTISGVQPPAGVQTIAIQKPRRKNILPVAIAACVALAVGGGIMYFAVKAKETPMQTGEVSSMIAEISSLGDSVPVSTNPADDGNGNMENAVNSEYADASAENLPDNAAADDPPQRNERKDNTDNPAEPEAPSDGEPPARVTHPASGGNEPAPTPEDPPAKTEPAKTEPAKTEPAKPETTKTEPAHTAPPQTQPPVQTTEASDFTYDDWNGGIMITGLKKQLSSVVIPESINGQTVTAIAGNAFAGYDFIQTLTMPDTVDEIGTRAFQDCVSLTSVRLSNNLTRVGEFAFQGTAIENIDLPDSLRVIDTSAFYGMEYLHKIIIPSSVESIGDYAFAQCEWLEIICIPTSVSHIGVRAFACDPICEGTVYYGGNSSERDMKDFSSSAFPAVEWVYNVQNFAVV